MLILRRHQPIWLGPRTLAVGDDFRNLSTVFKCAVNGLACKIEMLYLFLPTPVTGQLLLIC